MDSKEADEKYKYLKNLQKELVELEKQVYEKRKTILALERELSDAFTEMMNRVVLEQQNAKKEEK